MQKNFDLKVEIIISLDIMKTISITLLLLASSLVFGQRHELGLRLGVSNLVGDMGQSNYLPKRPLDALSGHYYRFAYPFYGGIFYKRNVSPQQAFRVDVGRFIVQFDDSIAEAFKQVRNKTDYNKGWVGELMYEYNFFPINEEQKRGIFSPYVFGGVGAMYSNANVVRTNNQLRPGTTAPTHATDFYTHFDYERRDLWTMHIPFGVGVKYKFHYNWTAFAELMLRYTFTDALDYSVTKETDYKIIDYTPALSESPYREEALRRTQEHIQQANVGNKNSKDWVNTISLGLSYSFGRRPCYCK